MITPYEGYVAVCEQLNARTPGDFPKKSALFNSGAEAVENARQAITAYLESLQAHGEPAPPPITGEVVEVGV